jgi:hypothetical protein
MEKDAEVKFEYGNKKFHTAQLFVDDLTWNNDRLIVKLAVEKTDCKARETCGVPVEVDAVAQEQCTPGSGCC